MGNRSRNCILVALAILSSACGRSHLMLHLWAPRLGTGPSRPSFAWSSGELGGDRGSVQQSAYGGSGGRGLLESYTAVAVVSAMPVMSTGSIGGRTFR
jgi:hypothetical protein